jgi:Fur family ferric uptake transcriptional regulator
MREEKADPVEIFVAFLRREGLNVTRSRLAVLRAVSAQPKHFEVAELQSSLRAQVSPATVYRTLGLLERAGLVRKLSFGETHAHYERAFGREDHGHFICQRCGRVWEFPIKGMRATLEKSAQAAGFSLREAVVEGYGLCRDCQTQGAKPV